MRTGAVLGDQVRSGIRIINEPYLGSSVFVVEAGENRTPSHTRYIAGWLAEAARSTDEPLLVLA
jgi:hypothetical protein